MQRGRHVAGERTPIGRLLLTGRTQTGQGGRRGTVAAGQTFFQQVTEGQHVQPLHRLGLGRRQGLQQRRSPEIPQPGLPRTIVQDVVGVEVPVGHATLVQVPQRLGQPRGQPQQGLRREAQRGRIDGVSSFSVQ